MPRDWRLDVLQLLKASPGLFLPQTQTRLADGSMLTVDNPGVLAFENLHRFLCLGTPNHSWWIGPHAYQRICEILERTQDRAQAQLNDFPRGHDTNVPLSTLHWRDVQYQMSYGTKAKDECHLELLLDNFVRLLLLARRDWMMSYPCLWITPPSDVLVARVHSCLMVLKKMHMRSQVRPAKKRRHQLSMLPLSVLGDRWLAFELSEEHIDLAVQACERAFPRNTSF